MTIKTLKVALKKMYENQNTRKKCVEFNFSK